MAFLDPFNSFFFIQLGLASASALSGVDDATIQGDLETWLATFYFGVDNDSTHSWKKSKSVVKRLIDAGISFKSLLSRFRLVFGRFAK